MADEFTQSSLSFLEEFKFQPSSTFHEDLRITDLRSQGRGRGIIATADIPADTELFIVPREYVISVENSRLFEQLPQLFDDTTNEDPGHHDEYNGELDGSQDGSSLPKAWLDLILVLVHDYLHRESSKWRAYWDVLPGFFDTLMFWSETELDELQASSVRGRIGKDSADTMFKSRIIPIVKANETVFYPVDQKHRFDDDQLLALCHRMGSLIMAYAFDLQTANDDDSDQEGAEDGWIEDVEFQTAMGMVPMADMLNADAEFNAHLEHGENELTMRSLRVIKQGEEVLNYYGPLGNGDLARRYGYTSALHSRYDVVELPWPAILNVIQDHFAKGAIDLAKMETNQDDVEETFVLERETGDPDETGQLNVEANFKIFPEELIEQVTTYTSAAMQLDRPGDLNEHEKKQLKQAFLQVMAQVISSRLAEYRTQAEDDEALLADSNLTVRLKMAIDIRLGEKRLLQEASTLVKELTTKYQDKRSTANDLNRPPQKKPRIAR